VSTFATTGRCGGCPSGLTESACPLPLVPLCLDQAVERYGALGEPAVRGLGAALVRTLGEIHGAGLVHRDLKPSNIVLTSRGPRIIDFGIARPEHGLTLTTTGQSLATPGYAAPEQVLGQRTGPAGDVFSLGVVLAYAAGGRPVYEGGHVAAVQYQVVHGEPELGSVPEAIRALVGERTRGRCRSDPRTIRSIRRWPRATACGRWSMTPAGGGSRRLTPAAEASPGRMPREATDAGNWRERATGSFCSTPGR
jgi:serine/threonine protein kinase